MPLLLPSREGLHGRAPCAVTPPHSHPQLAQEDVVLDRRQLEVQSPSNFFFFPGCANKTWRTDDATRLKIKNKNKETYRERRISSLLIIQYGMAFGHMGVILIKYYDELERNSAYKRETNRSVVVCLLRADSSTRSTHSTKMVYTDRE